MHDTSLAIGEKFFSLYAQMANPKVVEIGSQDVNGTLHGIMPPGAAYVGIDRAKGCNVNVVADAAALPLPTGYADIVLASSVLEHDPCFWQSFLEICRITRRSGYIYINAPSNGKVHRHPIDCWRFYPDAGNALAGWARRQGVEVTCVECFTAERASDVWNDFVAVFSREPVRSRKDNEFLYTLVASRNVTRFDRPGLLNESESTEDMDLIALARRALQVLVKSASGPARSRKKPPNADLGPFASDFETIWRAIDRGRSRLSGQKTRTARMPRHSRSA